MKLIILATDLNVITCILSACILIQYERLLLYPGSSPTATYDQIKTAYRKLSHKFHPDKNDGDEFFTERFKEIQEAYEILSNPDKRSEYDLQRENHSDNRPEILYFRSDKLEFYNGDLVTFYWKTNNASKVFLSPFCLVESQGSKTMIIKDPGSTEIVIELRAENTQSEKVENCFITLEYRGIKETSGRVKVKREKQKILGIRRIVFINAILKPILVFSTLFLIVYFLLRSL